MLNVSNVDGTASYTIEYRVTMEVVPDSDVAMNNPVQTPGTAPGTYAAIQALGQQYPDIYNWPAQRWAKVRQNCPEQRCNYTAFLKAVAESG